MRNKWEQESAIWSSQTLVLAGPVSLFLRLVASAFVETQNMDEAFPTWCLAYLPGFPLMPRLNICQLKRACYMIYRNMYCECLFCVGFSFDLDEKMTSTKRKYPGSKKKKSFPGQL